VDRINAVAQDAPPELGVKLRELASPQSSHTHPNEWLFPMLALVILGSVLFMMTRRKRT
jgi:hypothetical protein